MARKRSAKDLSIEELRRLMLEKQRAERESRVDSFRRTGRVSGGTVRSQKDARTAFQAVSRRTLDSVETGWRRPVTRSRRKSAFDRLLLVVEIVAVIGLVAILAYGINLLKTLNMEAVNAPVPAIPTSTPGIAPLVLPEGHTPPSVSGETQPNEAEIPEDLRPLAQALPTVPAPTSAPEQAVRIQIRAIKVDAPIVQGDGWEQLKKGVAQHLGTANPGQTGNLVLSAHNDVYGQIFRDLDRLKTGDTIVIYTATHQFTYTVTGSRIVKPTQVDVMDPTDKPVVTLISCYPYLVDNQRIVVTAVLKENIK